MSGGRPVVIVGGGPVGLTAANLLSARGVPVVLIERNATTSDEAKAISLDDESLRALDAAGLVGQVLDIVVPGTGTRYHDRRGRPLFHARGPESLRLGFPFKNQFAQPELERALITALAERPSVTVHLGTELVDLDDRDDRVVVTVRETGGTETRQIEASWVLGCDGGRSRVRELRGIGMIGTSHREVWMVVDTLGDHHDERFGMHHGTPDRPTVIVPGRNGRCRYEFLLRPGEGERNTTPSFEAVRSLVRPHREITPDEVERATNYTFNAVVADRWRDGHCLLLGDAAHMMPPFAGQGLNSGIRDAANLVWKLEQVWRGPSGPELLDTYEQERRPHAEAMVRFSEQLGQVVMTTRRGRALVRDLAVRALLLHPGGRRMLTQMRFRPATLHRHGAVVVGHPLVGRPLPQPRVLLAPALRLTMLDEVLGSGWAVLGVDVPAAAWTRVDETLGGIPGNACRVDVRPVEVVLGDRLPRATHGRAAIADADGRLETALTGAAGHLVLVRPDRYIAAVVGADDLAAALDHLGAALPRTGTAAITDLRKEPA